MDLNTRKERFSLAYINAVAAHAGYQLVEPPVDRDSIDGVVMGEFGRRPRIEFQAKATARNMVQGEHIAFPLPIKNYDDLRADVQTPRILIVVLMPNEETEWLAQSDDQLCLRYCGYWLSLANRFAVANSNNVTVHIPLANTFSSSQLSDLMGKVERGETL